jgi:hypothetical protein
MLVGASGRVIRQVLWDSRRFVVRLQVSALPPLVACHEMLDATLPTLWRWDRAQWMKSRALTAGIVPELMSGRPDRLRKPLTLTLR